MKNSTTHLSNFHDLTAPINTIELLLTEIRRTTPVKRRSREPLPNGPQDNHPSPQTLKELRYSQAIHGPKTWSIVNLRHVTEQAIENLTCAIKEANAQIVIGTMDHTNGDPHQLMSLIQNLISNSIKYRSPMQPPQVEVFAKATHPIRFYGPDNSMGMKANNGTHLPAI